MKPFAVALLLAFAPALHAHEGPLDSTFGDGGFRHYGFLPVENDRNDFGSVACPGPNGTLTVSGIASGGRRVVTARLLPTGDYDTSFSGDGKEAFDLSNGAGSYAPAVCQADGNPVIATVLTDASGEQNLRVFRVSKDTGLLDAGFGNGGVIDLDLDAYRNDLGKAEVPLGINVLANGDLAVSGYATLADTSVYAFIALLDASGSVRAVSVVTSFSSWQATTTLESPDGSLWLFGSSGFAAYRATLNRSTLNLTGSLVVSNLGATVRPGAARLVRSDAVAMAATLANSDGSLSPVLIVFHGDRITPLPLPTPMVQGAPVSMSVRGVFHGVSILPGNRVLFAGTTNKAGSGFDTGLYFAMAHIGRGLSDDEVEVAFGNGGAQTALFQPNTAGCAAAPPLQWLARVTKWGGRPVIVGSAQVDCDNGSSWDYLVGRIETNYLFADGFD